MTHHQMGNTTVSPPFEWSASFFMSKNWLIKCSLGNTTVGPFKWSATVLRSKNGLIKVLLNFRTLLSIAGHSSKESAHVVTHRDERQTLSMSRTQECPSVYGLSVSKLLMRGVQYSVGALMCPSLGDRWVTSKNKFENRGKQVTLNL